MRLAWLTDIHINFVKPADYRAFLENLSYVEADAILISGDIGESHTVAAYLKSMSEAVTLPIYFVLGNHDFYHGSISGVRELIQRLVSGVPRLRWLNQAGVVRLSRKTALVGHDSWCDARLGDFENSNVMLNDFRLIEDLRGLESETLRATLQRLGDESAAHIRRHLPRALEDYEHVVIAVHVPPFEGAAWHEGKPSTKEWLPFFACQSAGDAILEIMKQRPDRQLTVLCGHTHGEGAFYPASNVEVFSGGAVYGSPTVQRVLELP